MKKKIILTIGLLFALVKGYAQVKIGSNATTITSNKYLEVEATNGKKVNINKDDGRVFIENKPSASLTDSVVMRYSDGDSSNFYVPFGRSIERISRFGWGWYSE